MSLLDDVSIVVTPNGYKAGELYAVVPVPTEGAELITDGNFPTPNVNWIIQGGASTTWVINNNTATRTGSANWGLYQNITRTVGSLYKITFNVLTYTSGTLAIVLGGGAANVVSGTGSKTLYLIWDGSTDKFSLQNNFIGSIENVSVKEYTSADMDVTRATAATRVDENGLVNYAEIIGGEEVTNGDFATDTDWVKAPSGVTISGGSANFNLASDTYVYQDILTATKTYKIIFSGTINSGSLYIGENGIATNIYTVGTYTNEVAYFTAASSVRFIIRKDGVGTLDATIDNISIKEVTRDNVPRIDYTGGEDILGGEEIIDGDFPTPNVNWSLGGGTEVTVDGLRINNTVITGNAYAIQTLSVSTSSKQFVLTYDVITTNGEDLFLEQASGLVLNTSTTGVNRKLYFTWDKVDSRVTIKRINAGTDVTIDNVSVKEVTGNTGVASCPHILAEPQRTNLLPYSEDFSQWIDADVTLTANATTSPSGSLDATLVDLSSTTDSRLVNNVGVVASTEYTLSFYLKKHESDSDGTFPLAYYDGSNYIKTYVNLTDVWQRFDLTFTNPSNSPFGYGLSRKGTTSDETLTRCYAWGGQLEQASYPTSYIPTSGSTVTRNQDIFTRDGIGSLINSTEGVLFVEMARQEGDASAGIITLNNGTATQAVALYYFSTGTIYFDIISSSSTVSGGVGGFNTYNFNKIALKYKSGDIALWVNGVEVLTRTNTISLTGLNKLSFDYGGGALPFYGKVKQLQVYKTALTDVQLAALTS